MRKVCRTVLVIGFTIQIALGLGWMVLNFSYVQDFGESALYAEISKTFICDEYVGILYPVFILLARGMEKIFLIPYHCILYSLQLAAAFAAGSRLMGSVGVKDGHWKCFASMALLTLPMAMQCHLAVLPDSLVSSLLLFEISLGLDIVLSGKRFCCRKFAGVLSCWLVLALLQPEYFCSGAVTAAVLFWYGAVKEWRQCKRQILRYGILFLAFGGIYCGVKSLTQIEGYYGRTSKSIQAAAASRFVWPYASKDFEEWPAEVQELFSWEEAVQLDYYADNMERVLGRKLENAFGAGSARAYLGEIAEIGWNNRRYTNLHHLAWDVVGYTFSPMVVQRQLAGKAYDSYTGRNYDVMRANAPNLSRYYLDYGCWWFVAGLGISALMQLLVLFQEKGSFWSGGKRIALMGWIVTICSIVFYYTMRGAGMMDYKKSVAVILLWLVWMLAVGDRAVRKG